MIYLGIQNNTTILHMKIANKPLKTHVTTIRFDNKLWDKLEDYAARNDMSIASVIRREVRSLLAKRES